MRYWTPLLWSLSSMYDHCGPAGAGDSGSQLPMLKDCEPPCTSTWQAPEEALSAVQPAAGAEESAPQTDR